MTEATEHPNPTSWRDVYQLVRDTRKDVLEAVAAVDKKVESVGARVTTIEDERMVEAAAEAAERRVFGRARSIVVSTVALLVSILSGVAALFSVIASTGGP